MNDEELKKAFKEVHDKVISTDEFQYSHDLKNNSTENLHENQVTLAMELWSIIRTNFLEMKDISIYTSRRIDWRRIFRDIVEFYYQASPEYSKHDFRKLFSALSQLHLESKYLNAFLFDLESKQTCLKYNIFILDCSILRHDDEDALEKLEHYLNIAELVRSESNFETMNVRKLEKYILDAGSCVRDLSSGTDKNYYAQNSFFALAAPSMEGKTQSAFIFKELKPLYFSLAWRDQYIYQNYSYLSISLEQISKYDSTEIQLLSPDREWKGFFVNCEDIQLDFKHVPLLTLGFIVYLVQDAQKNYNSSVPWMKYHSSRPSFNFSRISYEAFLGMKISFKGFCLFIDEFFDSDWAIYIRNLARAINLPCVVANTNAKIGGYVGRRRSIEPDELFVWSFVVTHLDGSSIGVIDKMGNLINSIDTIKTKIAGTIDSGVICDFLDDLKDNQIKHLRPGMALFVADVLKLFPQKFKKTTKVNLKVFLDFICTELTNNLFIRKPTFRSYDEARCGHIGLFLPETFKIESNNQTFSNEFQYIDFHLYYLRNPQRPTHWIFFTLPPKPNCDDLLIPIPGKDDYTWKVECTYFNEKEFLTIFGCMFFPIYASVTWILIYAKAEIIKNSIESDVILTRSMAPSSHLNPLNISSAASILNATHHSIKKFAVATFSGQPGTDFINNLINNLIEDSSFRKYTENDNRRIVAYPVTGFDLKKYLARCRIPFLYSLDRKEPLLQRLSISSSSIFVSVYERNSVDGVDGRFIFKSPDDSIVQACVECKNYADKLEIKNVFASIKNFIKNTNNSKLSLIFCRSIYGRETLSRQYYNFCQTESINVYRVKFEGKCSIIPYSPIVSNPKHISIILESDYIQTRRI